MEAEYLLECIKNAFGKYSDLIIADITKMADGDLDSWLWGLNIGYLSSIKGLEWRLNDDF